MHILHWPMVFPGLALILGLLLGSFYNVCVHRYLAGQSIVRPRSHCPACGHVLSWWENIPIFSYILLRARCYGCGVLIPWRYPALELLSGILAWALAWKFGLSWSWLVYMIFIGIFLVASFIDLDSFILPNELTYPAAVLALLTPLILPVDWLETWAGSFIGAGLFLVLQQGYLRWRKLDALGTGDIKLMLSLGALVGLTMLPLMILLSALSALVVALIYLRQDGGQGLQTAIPFGPFLCLGCVLVLLWGENILSLIIGS